jgi:hypothetical protein
MNHFIILQRLLLLLVCTIGVICSSLAQDEKILAAAPLFEDIDKDASYEYPKGANTFRVECNSDKEAIGNEKLLVLSIGPNKQITPMRSHAVLDFPLGDLLLDQKEHKVALLFSGAQKGEVALKPKKEAAVTAAPAATHYEIAKPAKDIDLLQHVTLQRANDVLTSPVGYVPANAEAYELIYSFCDNKLWHKPDKKAPKVGSGVTLELKNVPNPLLYDVSIASRYQDYNAETDQFLEDLLLNPADKLGKAFSGGADDQAAKDRKKRKEIILGYLYAINADLNKFLGEYAHKDCIDAADFATQKKMVEDNLDTKLKAVNDFNYSGYFPDLIRSEFDEADSSLVKPFLLTYKKFHDLRITPYRFHIPRVKNADELTIGLKIIPKDGSNATLKVDSMEIPVTIYGGFKVDVSPGIFYTSLNSARYTLRSDSMMVPGSTGADSVTDRYKTIIQEKGKNSNVVFGTLMNFYSRWGKDVNVALNIGAGVTLEAKPQVRYLGGVSVLLGRINRLALSGGFVFGKVDGLSNRYNNDTNGNGYLKVNNSETELQTRPELKSGWYLGVSYNIPLLARKKKAEASGTADDTKTVAKTVATPDASSENKKEETANAPKKGN